MKDILRISESFSFFCFDLVDFFVFDKNSLVSF